MMKRQHAAGFAAYVIALAVAVAPIAAQEQAPVRVPRSVLERYAGEYVQDGTTIKVYVSGDTLFREVPGQRTVLLPLSESLFKMGPIFTAEFVTDEAGGVTQVVASAVVEFRIPRKGHPPAPPESATAVHVPRSVLEWRVVDEDSGFSNPHLADGEDELILVCHEVYSSSFAASSLHALGRTRGADLVGGFDACERSA